ncbi:MAG: inorganic phosphate transporter [Actinomycetota bacterium]|nr:inorganic phosphate transporter [Actinomycetota bacterium]
MAATERIWLTALALAFAFVSGANDGVTLAATSARSRAMAPLVALGVLAVAVGAVPLVLGTGVAGTVAHGLVSFERSDGQLAFLCAGLCALVVVLTLSRRGLPTSLTMALTGAIVGAGLGAGLPTRWSTVAAVLLSGVVAPIVSGLLAYLLAPGTRTLLGARRRCRGARALQLVAYLGQCIAYGVNDGEKLVALLAVASAAPGGAVRASAGGQALLAGAFAAGGLLFLRRTATRVAGQMVRASEEGTLAAVVAATVAVVGGAAAGMPLSSTQATTAALLGGSARLVPWGVRWQQVRSIGLAWALTLPLATGLAFGAGLLIRR